MSAAVLFGFVTFTEQPNTKLPLHISVTGLLSQIVLRDIVHQKVDSRSMVEWVRSALSEQSGHPRF